MRFCLHYYHTLCLIDLGDDDDEFNDNDNEDDDDDDDVDVQDANERRKVRVGSCGGKNGVAVHHSTIKTSIRIGVVIIIVMVRINRIITINNKRVITSIIKVIIKNFARGTTDPGY